MVTSFNKRLARRFKGGNSGALMVEALIAVLIFTMLGVAALIGLQTTLTAGNRTQGQSIAESVARSQMEFVFSQAYQDPPTAYPTVTPPTGYSVTANASEAQPGVSTLQRVTVSVSREGRTLLEMETFRVKP